MQSDRLQAPRSPPSRRTFTPDSWCGKISPPTPFSSSCRRLISCQVCTAPAVLRLLQAKRTSAALDCLPAHGPCYRTGVRVLSRAVCGPLAIWTHAEELAPCVGGARVQGSAYGVTTQRQDSPGARSRFAGVRDRLRALRPIRLCGQNNGVKAAGQEPRRLAPPASAVCASFSLCALPRPMLRLLLRETRAAPA